LMSPSFFCFWFGSLTGSKLYACWIDRLYLMFDFFASWFDLIIMLRLPPPRHAICLQSGSFYSLDSVQHLVQHFLVSLAHVYFDGFSFFFFFTYFHVLYVIDEYNILAGTISSNVGSHNLVPIP
jgi:hypothetical protein